MKLYVVTVYECVWRVCCRVYNRNLELVQVSRGHSDAIRAVIHIPDRKQVHRSSSVKNALIFTVPIYTHC